MRRTVRGLLAPAAVGVLAVGLAGCGGASSEVPSSADPASSTVVSATPSSAFPAAGSALLEEPFDDDSHGWGVVDDPEFGSARFDGGQYVWKTTGRVVALVPASLGEQFDAGTLSMSDVVLAADVTITKGGGVVGLQCRNSPDTDAGYQWYDFVARDGYVAIRLSDDRSNIEVLAERKDVSIPTGTRFSIGAACITAGDDVELSMAIDDERVLSTTAPAAATDGVPGIVGWTYPLHSELDVSWDDLTISRPAS
jgi:hypothetical protein